MASIVKKTLFIDDMTCVACENKIEKKLKTLEGIIKVSASYSSGTANFEYDKEKISLDKITSVITKLGYGVKGSSVAKQKSDTSTSIASSTKIQPAQLICIVLILFGMMVIMNNLGLSSITNKFPTATQGMGYLALFVVGLFTSVHCVAMCGGINISQCANIKYTSGTGMKSKLEPSLLYNGGRVISYTIVGGIVGALGSVFQFSGTMKGIVAVLAGVFMIIMGLNMMNVFPWLRKFNPRLPKIFGGINSEGKGPLVVGLLNGLMPCGPLQAMQLYALLTGSPVTGALSMLFFSLGTTPLMFGLGAISSMLTKKFTKKMMTVSAVLVVFLGVGMFSTGMSLSGITLPGVGTSGEAVAAIVKDGVQTVTVNVTSGSYEPITVKAGIPVKLVFHAEKGNINGCNGTIIIPKYNIEQQLQEGDTEVEFTPTTTGTIPYSCWMGMIKSTITVVD